MLSDTHVKVRGLADLPEVQSDSLLALIALCDADPRAEKIDVGGPAPQEQEQEAICYLLAEKAREGKTVAPLRPPVKAIRRGLSSSTSPSHQSRPSRAGATAVVLPAPGGATSTALGPTSSAASRSGRTVSTGRLGGCIGGRDTWQKLSADDSPVS